MDALSEALSAVRMTGAIFFHAECTAPWGFSMSAFTPDLTRMLAPGTERIVSYHLLTEGEAVVRFEDGEPIPFAPGDVLITPHGTPHTIVNGSPPALVDSSTGLRGYLSGESRCFRVDGGGPKTRFVCGYFGCERSADRMFLAGLPTMIKINLRGDATGEWLESTIRHLVVEADTDRPGRSILLSKAAEALFIEAMRRYMADLPPEHRGWLAGARDPIVGRSLALMHRKPFHRWTLAELAKEAGASRSVLAKRFKDFLGQPPLTYLASWRLHLAARLLETSRKTVLEVASEVGYESEAAFNRAFKREFGVPPGRRRRRIADSDDGVRVQADPVPA